MRWLPLLSFIFTIKVDAPVFVFDALDDGYAHFRIPAITQLDNGALLAFGEGRPTQRDFGDIDLVGSVSLDQGVTWTDPQIIYDQRGTCGSPLVISLGDRVVLLFNQYPLDKETYAYRRIKRVFITLEGTTLVVSKARDITEETKNPRSLGPGTGLRLEDGSLLAPVRHGHLISHDQGDSWVFEPIDVEDRTGESALTRTPDGCLLRADRQDGPRDGERAVFRQLITRNCGQGWSPYAYADELTVPGHYCASCDTTARNCECPEGGKLLFCQSALGATANFAYFIAPGSTRNRHDLTLWTSTNDGISWENRTRLLKGSTGYSSAVTLKDGSIGVLAERFISEPAAGCNAHANEKHQNIVFIRARL